MFTNWIEEVREMFLMRDLEAVAADNGYELYSALVDYVGVDNV